MLDLDSLAQRRAQTLNEKEDVWRKAVWSAGFQKISANMSDGEVENFLSVCPSVTHLEWAVKYLSERTNFGNETPFSILTQEAAKSGQSIEQWISAQMAAKRQ